MTNTELEELRLSVSKTKTFAQCKKQFEFSYVLKMPKKERDYLIFGKFCHKVLETFHQAYIDGCLLPFNVSMKGAWQIAWAEFKDNMTPEMKKECWNIVDKYLRMITNNPKMVSCVLAVEKKFALPLSGNVLLNGFIDKVQLDDDGVLRVSDYKSSKSSKYLKDDWYQILTYAYVLLKEDPNITKVRGSYIMLKHDFEEVTREFEVEEIMTAEKKFLEYAEQIRGETEYAPNPTALCGWCDHLSLCDAGQKQTRMFSGEVEW